MKILVPGGAGYIGSHTVLHLVKAGHEVVIVDSFVNSSEESIRRIRKLSGKPEAIKFFKGDIRDEEFLETVFIEHPHFDATIHFAALKSVSESVQKPLLYYENNVGGTISLLKVLKKHKCTNFVFSSSATVYGDAPVPETGLAEDAPVGKGITNPYGQTKFMMEGVLQDLSKADPDFGVILLRYFNPVGAHPSGEIGEDPRDIPNNLMPYVMQVAIGRREKLSVFAEPPYETPDGTGVRDYIHVEDLAAGHLKALEYLWANPGTCDSINLGTGNGYSVLEMVKAAEESSKKPVPYVIAPRRDGDLASVYANPTKALELLGWTARYNCQDMVRDQWKFQSKNPMGYEAEPESEA
eukprot:TRINITY_DN774020_c0_g1_i1.p1 TRINITY_DN774020_c0_g1~~TRINITY_DN774020_c0_g1_i1.p1  ORF type:complete len:353 (+),score=120.23 TRINITY_DN774020_c0_g1_i1:55-1113(+)